LTSSCSVADAATAPSFASTPRRAELGERAALRGNRSGADGHDCSSRLAQRVAVGAQSVQPQPRRETDRSLSSPATAVCISQVCGSRPHATRCAWAVHGTNCGWRARDAARWCGFYTFAFRQPFGDLASGEICANAESPTYYNNIQVTRLYLRLSSFSICWISSSSNYFN